jgi:hypothetical protein
VLLGELQEKEEEEEHHMIMMLIFLHLVAHQQLLEAVLAQWLDQI